MDHLRILKRSLNISWHYRALWVFGILLALTTSRNGGSNAGAQTTGNGDFVPTPGWQFPGGRIPPEVVAGLVAVAIAVIVFVLVLAVAFAILRYVAKTALLRMVDDYEATGEKRRVGWGFRAGWSRTSWRLFLIDLIIGLPLVLLSIVLFLMALSPLLLWITKSPVFGALGTVSTIGMVFLLVMFLIVVGAVLSVLLQFFWRVCAFEGAGVIDSIREGFGMVRRNFRDVAIMWLIMVGIGIAWVAVLVPLVIVLLIVGVGVGGLPALLIGGLTRLIVGGGAAPWILAAIVGIFVFILVVGLPMLFVQGLMEVFTSTTWTLTYRELRALESTSADEATLLASEPVSA